MSDLTKEQVDKLLKLQGHDVPDKDLTEVTHRLNALMERLRHFDSLDLCNVEPWPLELLRCGLNG